MRDTSYGGSVLVVLGVAAAWCGIVRAAAVHGPRKIVLDDVTGEKREGAGQSGVCAVGRLSRRGKCDQ